MSKASFSSFLLHVHPRVIPEHAARVRFTWCLGGLAVWMFVLEAVTGALLLLHYVPALSGAYPSVQQVTHVVPYGFFLRGLHYWCGQVMVVLVVMHMARVVITKSYAPPRQVNWLIGLGLLVGTVVVDFTGYLLVWDDRALWAWTIARNLAESVPAIGPLVAALLFGSPDAADATLVRLYAWHVFLLPGVMIALMMWHFWRIRKDGGISGPL
jgi:quinol-cytochrome oxidoreductase complex cytochrome b subunit